jgi:hypothetical protein
MTKNAESLFNAARLRQKYAGGGSVRVVIAGRHGDGVLSDVDQQKALEEGGFIQQIDAELMLRQSEFPAPELGTRITAEGKTFRVMSVSDDHRMREWVLSLQAENR